MSSPIRHCENDDAGARLTYEAIDFDDAAQRDWLVADLRRAADDPGTERPQWWIEAPHHAADDVAAAAGWERVRSLCLLYTSDAADDLPCVDLGGRRMITQKKRHTTRLSLDTR